MSKPSCTTKAVAKVAKFPLTKGKVDPKPAQDPCTNVLVCPGQASSSMCFPKWTITKTTQGSSCFNANGAESPSANYLVTITNPSIADAGVGIQLCWSVEFTVTNNTGSDIVISSYDVDLVIGGVVVPRTVQGPFDISNGASQCFLFSICDFIECGDGEVVAAQITVTYTCGTPPVTYTTSPPLVIPLGTLTCEDPTCYVFADAAECLINGIPSGPADVAITATNPTSFDPTSCSELSTIAAGVNGGTPFPLPVGGLILICPGCFPPSGQIQFTIEATCPDLPTDCSSTYAIDNVAEITKVVQVEPTAPCPPNSSQTTTLDGTVVCVSTLECDTSSATATADITCVVPAICVTTNVQCNENLCVCKRSTVLTTPPAILYDITFSETSDTGCTFTVTFVFVACPSTQYTYQIQTVTGGVPTTIVGPLPAIPCPVGTPITTSTDGCNTCTTLPLPACAITSPAIPFTEVAGVDSLQITVTGPGGEVIIPATNICIPSEQGGENVCLGDCITITCNPAPTPPATCCVFDPIAAGAVTVVSTGNECADAQILALLIGNGNVAFFPPECDRITGGASDTGILNVPCGTLPGLLPLITAEITLIETYGLHFIAGIPSTCCGCITVSNTIRLLTGSPTCDPTPPSSCVPAVVVSDQSEALYNTIQLPCCPPVITSITPLIQTVPPAMLTTVGYTITGSGFLPLTSVNIVSVPVGAIGVEFQTIESSTDSSISDLVQIVTSTGGVLQFSVTTSCGTSNTFDVTIGIIGAKPAIGRRAILPVSKSSVTRPSNTPKSKVVVRNLGPKK